MNSKDKAKLLNYLYESGLIGNFKINNKLKKQFNSDIDFIMRYHSSYVPISVIGLDFNKTDFENRFNMSGVYIDGIQFNGIKFSKGRIFFLRDSYASHAVFANAELNKADFVRTKLLWTQWANSDLTGANFYKADLRGAHFSAWYTKDRMIFNFKTAAVLKDANFEYADLSNALISAEQLKSAKSLEGATMPNGKIYDKTIPIEKQVLDLKIVK